MASLFPAIEKLHRRSFFSSSSLTVNIPHQDRVRCYVSLPYRPILSRFHLSLPLPPSLSLKLPCITAGRGLTICVKGRRLRALTDDGDGSVILERGDDGRGGRRRRKNGRGRGREELCHHYHQKQEYHHFPTTITTISASPWVFSLSF